MQVLKQQTPAVAALKHRIQSYSSLDLEYDAWKLEIETSSNAIQESIQDLNTALNPLVTSVEALEKENYSAMVYNNWKNSTFTQFKKKYELVQYDANKLLENETLKDKIKVLASNDGYLELSDSKTENNFSDAEKKLFLKNIPASYKLGHEIALNEEEKALPLFEDGPQIKDIEQGQVADCYLLAAMANLANEDTAHLLEEMIEEKEINGKKVYVVTLYQEGIPVKVEVDGKFMTLTAPKEENLKNPKRHLGAVPKDDIWVPIIEKAYAKLMEKGDYKLIENDTPQNAMKALLGNKVETPNSFLLDKQGKLILEEEGTYIKNPIPLASTSLQDLQQLLTLAQEKGYKMNLSSPDTYKGAKGLNHNHVLNLGGGNYMSFDHIYTITSINGNIVAVFNPHGKTANVGVFLDQNLHQLMQELTVVKDQLEKDYKTESFSNSSKDAMRKIAEKLNASASKSFFWKIINLLESIHEDGLKEKGDAWVFAKKKYEKKFDDFIDAVNKVLASDIGKGFASLDNNSKIKTNQNIPLNAIKEHFEYIVINIIK